MNDTFNVVLIVLDTMREDAVYPIETNERMPFLREFSKECIVFKNAVSPASWTIPAHASIFTGLYPSRNGVIERVNGEIPNYSDLFERYEGDTLAEKLSKRGYKTLGFSQNLLIAPDTSFSRGFDEFYYTHNPNQDVYFRMLENYNKIIKNYGSSLKEILQKLSSLSEFRKFISLYSALKKDTRNLKNSDLTDKGGQQVIDRVNELDLKDPFFIFINLMEMHDPHDSRSLNLGWSDSFFREKRLPVKFVEEIRKSYYDATKTTDKILSRLIDNLKERKILDKTILIITSDHGQGLMEKDDFFGHGTFLYDELIKIPLIIRMPNGDKFNVKEGFQSTSKIKGFIERILNDYDLYDSITEDFVFSECYGSLDKEIRRYSGNKKYKEVLYQIDRPRKAIFYKNYKLVFDMKEKRIEELKSIVMDNGLNATDKNIGEMIDLIDIFSWSA